MRITCTSASAAAVVAFAGLVPVRPTEAAPPAASGPSVESVPAAACGALIAAQDSRTRVYLVNGPDPFGWADVAGLGDRIRKGGYPRTRVGEVYDLIQFEREIRTTAREDPTARFALIGFSVSTLAVRGSAAHLTRDGVPVALLGYVGGDYLQDTAWAQPAGVGRVVNVTGEGYLLTGRSLFWNGTNLTGATNVRLRGVAHFALPSHPQTLAALRTGLADVSREP